MKSADFPIITTATYSRQTAITKLGFKKYIYKNTSC